MKQLSVDLPNTTYHWLNSQVKINHFANINEYIQDLISKEQQMITDDLDGVIRPHCFNEIIEKTRKELKEKE